jgi:uncharacterized tellurite resistance protein B-like protein
MSGIFDQFREKVFHSVWKEKSDEPQQVAVDDKIALGVLLWEVAQADNKFLPEEKDKIKDVLKQYSNIPEDQVSYVMESIEIASRDKIDLHTFTREVSHDLSRDIKKDIIENLFRVACIDGDLAHEEEETIRKISGLFRLEHKDFIDSKIKVKKEFGMDTAGL